jgi:hypothetical protein
MLMKAFESMNKSAVEDTTNKARDYQDEVR